MKWEDYVTASENVLGSPHVPSSLQIITLIKNVNPTKLTLSETDRERGYLLKSRLQSLLLEHYGDSFHLVPHPASPNIILIKHLTLPSIDACHAQAGALSSLAIERTEAAAPPRPAKKESKRNRGKKRRETGAACSAKEVLRTAMALLDEYDYTAAEEVLADLRVHNGSDLPVLMRAAGIMLQEIGAYQLCIDTLLSQSANVLKDRGIREMLGVAYHRNGCIPEARAIFEELPPAELGLDALVAYAEITFNDGNLAAALELVTIAKRKEGFLSRLDELQKEITEAMSAQAEPVVQKAQAMFRSGAMEEAKRLAGEALALNPVCHQARAVLSAIEAMNDEACLAVLWRRLETERDGETRLVLLAQLMERDKEKQTVIKKLIAQEREGQRRRQFDEQLELLSNLVQRECWPECFDRVTSLMKQPDFGRRADDVLSLSPFFSVLHENRRLNGISERAAKELWLRLVNVKIALAGGDGAGCFETMQELKPWFNSYPLFREDYLSLRQTEQEKARLEIAALLGQSETQECTANEVRRIHVTVKKKMQVLALEERGELVRTMDERLARLVPGDAPELLLEEYRDALQTGNSEKAAHLRKEIGENPALEALDAEFAAAFHIAVAPLSLEFSDTLPIDLTTQPPFLLNWLTDTQVFLKESEDTVVMIDFDAKAACKVTSPAFANLALFDCINGKTFLFRERVGEEREGEEREDEEREDEDRYGTKVWRADLSVEGGRFTASFDMRERFETEDGFYLETIFMSSERDSDYYVLTKHEEGRLPAKVVRRRLSQKAVVHSLQLGNRTELDMWRWNSRPDRFIIGGDGEMRHVDRKLSTKARLSITPQIFKADAGKGCIYGLEDYFLTQRNERLEFIKVWETAPGLGLYGSQRTYGMSFETDTVLVAVGGDKQSFYDLSNNKYSQKVRLGSVLPFNRDGRWYCYHYNKDERKLRLRDITSDIHSILEWRQFVFPRKKAKNMNKILIWFNQPHNFVYRPQDWDSAGSTS